MSCYSLVKIDDPLVTEEYNTNGDDSGGETEGQLTDDVEVTVTAPPSMCPNNISLALLSHACFAPTSRSTTELANCPRISIVVVDAFVESRVNESL